MALARADQSTKLGGLPPPSDNETVTHPIAVDPETMHGVPVFRGSRVPVQTLFEYLAGGDTLEDFLLGFPTVQRSLALEALEEGRKLLLEHASPVPGP